ncbi:MAG: exo-alpha-sialidase [Pedobacter sp.]|nr:MAG: exo-alpha-sialidase [Pedobacter sp.]
MVRLVSYLVVALLCTPFWGVAQKVQKTVVWTQNEDNINTHFVYGLTVTKKGTILAMAEARIDDWRDDSAHHLVLKRSTNKGKTFLPNQIIQESKNGESWANPTLVQDHTTQEIFLFYALNQHNASSRLFYRTSKDEGATWSEPTEVTALFEPNKHAWTFHLPGPGHGIQLQKGRLIVQVWHRRSIAFAAPERRYGVNCIYSDDHGKTWQVGGDSPVGEFNESQIVELQNGDLLLVARTHHAEGNSYQAKVISKDGGETWTQEAQYDAGLSGTVCDMGLVAYDPKPGYLIASQPAELTKRRNLTIRLSKDEGKTWMYNKLLQEGPSTYSDLAILPDKSIICLYGLGGNRAVPDEVAIARFKLKWLKSKSK